MKDRISDEKLGGLIHDLKSKSSGRSVYDTCAFGGGEVRTLIDVCKDLQDARSLLEKTSWLRKPGKKAEKGGRS